MISLIHIPNQVLKELVPSILHLTMFVQMLVVSWITIRYYLAGTVYISNTVNDFPIFQASHDKWTCCSEEDLRKYYQSNQPFCLDDNISGDSSLISFGCGAPTAAGSSSSSSSSSSISSASSTTTTTAATPTKSRGQQFLIDTFGDGDLTRVLDLLEVDLLLEVIFRLVETSGFPNDPLAGIASVSVLGVLGIAGISVTFFAG